MPSPPEPNKTNTSSAKIGITIGDCNGIGPELIIKILGNKKILESNPLIIYGQPKVIIYHLKKFNIRDFRFQLIQGANEATSGRINLINCLNEDGMVEPGIPTDFSGRLAKAALEKAGIDLKDGSLSGVVTAPVSKSNLTKQGFSFPGQTEFFASLEPNSKTLMLLVAENLRIGLVTGHLPISKVAENITSEMVSQKLETLLKGLKNSFGIAKPKIAILALNPHGGEKGTIGTEEMDWMEKLVLDKKEKGQLVFGPFPADGLFGSGNYKKFDAILGMYHDQALIPFKTLAFEEGINCTVGLNFIRTSPDHGTAFDIAGKNIASENSFRAAIYLAMDLASRMKENNL